LNTIVGEFQKLVHSNDFGARFFMNIGETCNNDKTSLEHLLKFNGDFPWPEIALTSSIKNVKPDTIQTVLRLIKHSDIETSLRERMFLWLCVISRLHRG